jgi:hypothetical protein
MRVNKKMALGRQLPGGDRGSCVSKLLDAASSLGGALQASSQASTSQIHSACDHVNSKQSNLDIMTMWS